MITFREELDTWVQDSKKKTTKSKKIMLVINSIKEFKNIVKNDPEFKYRATQILTKLLWVQDLSEANFTSTKSYE